MFEGEEVLSYLLDEIEDELRDAGVVDYASTATNMPTTLKEFLYRSWVAAERELGTSVWSGSVTDGNLVIQAEIECEGQSFTVLCKENLLEISESTDTYDAQGNANVNTLSIRALSTSKDTYTFSVGLELPAEATDFFFNVCSGVLDTFSTLVDAKQINCTDNLVNAMALLEKALVDNTTFEVPKRVVPAAT
jgi:hypothetical protein